VARDVETATTVDHLTATPTVVIVHKGKRETVSGGVTFPLLKTYLNDKLSE